MSRLLRHGKIRGRVLTSTAIAVVVVATAAVVVFVIGFVLLLADTGFSSNEVKGGIVGSRWDGFVFFFHCLSTPHLRTGFLVNV